MIHRRRGFLLYLAFVVTTVLLLMVLSGQDVARFTLDAARSGTLDTIGFHAADGGLEQGLARLRSAFQPFRFSYSFTSTPYRNVQVEVTATPGAGHTMDLRAESCIFEGGKRVSVRGLARQGIQETPDRRGSGTFVEVL